MRYVKKLSLEPPKILSCKLRLLVSANQDSDEEGDEDEDVLKLVQAESLPVTHAADVSLRLPARSALICLVALKRSELQIISEKKRTHVPRYKYAQVNQSVDNRNY